MKTKQLLFITIFLCVSAFASWQDMAKGVMDSLTTKQTSSTNDAQEQTLVAKALKEALNQGVTTATSALSKENGFLNSSVKIPLPNNLKNIEGIIRKAGGGQYADELILAMNSAASKSIPQTVSIFKDAISNISIEDAMKILNGSNTATTDYFQNKTENSLTQAIAPIVKQSMAQSQVATYYKAFNDFYQTQSKSLIESSALTSYAKNLGVDSYLPSSEESHLEEYITAKTIDGLFAFIAKEEKAIRTNPASRTTQLLEEVFGK